MVCSHCVYEYDIEADPASLFQTHFKIKESMSVSDDPRQRDYGSGESSYPQQWQQGQPHPPVLPCP